MIRSPRSLLSRLNSPNSQPFLTAEVLQPSDHLCGPPLAPLQQVHVCPVLGAPELGAGLQVGSHQSRAEGQNHLPRPRGRWILTRDKEEVVCFLPWGWWNTGRGTRARPAPLDGARTLAVGPAALRRELPGPGGMRARSRQAPRDAAPAVSSGEVVWAATLGAWQWGRSCPSCALCGPRSAAARLGSGTGVQGLFKSLVSWDAKSERNWGILSPQIIIILLELSEINGSEGQAAVCQYRRTEDWLFCPFPCLLRLRVDSPLPGIVLKPKGKGNEPEGPSPYARREV